MQKKIYLVFERVRETVGYGRGEDEYAYVWTTVFKAAFTEKENAEACAKTFGPYSTASVLETDLKEGAYYGDNLA